MFQKSLSSFSEELFNLVRGRRTLRALELECALALVGRVTTGLDREIGPGEGSLK